MSNIIIPQPIMNADGTINRDSTGYKYTIDTLTTIKEKVVKQKFYEIAVSDYMPVDVNSKGFTDEIVQNRSYETGGDFFSGDVKTVEGNGNIGSVDTAFDTIRMPVKSWAKASHYTVIELQKAMIAQNWDIVESKLQSLKKNWDLGIQRVAFLGHPSIGLMTGLLNDTDVNINTSLVPAPLSTMTTAQFTSFVAGALAAYNNNAQATAYPDTFIIPTDDYLGLAVPYDSASPVNPISRLTYLEESFKKMTRNEGFRILPLAYASDNYNSDSINENRYVLYRNQEDTLAMNIPVDFTMLQANTSNEFTFQQVAYGQYSGALINRKREILYFDDQS